MRGSGSQARLIEDFLRREYGVKRVDIEHRTKHAKLHWEHQGGAYSYMCSRNTTGDGHAALQNARSNIRRMMKGPAFNPVLEEGAMEDVMEAIREKAILQVQVDAPQPAPEPELSRTTTMAPEAGQPEQPPARIWPVRAAAYMAQPDARCPTLCLTFTDEIVAELPTFEAQKLDDEHWKLLPGGERKWSIRGRQARANINVRSGMTPFASMHVDAIQADGEVLVYIPLAGRRPPQPPLYQQKAPIAAPAPRQPEPEPAPLPEPSRWAREFQKQTEAGAKPEQGPVEFRMREILRQIREIEQITPYTLKISEAGKLIWHAPVIE